VNLPIFQDHPPNPRRNAQTKEETMLFTTRINDLVTSYPKLSRIWIKTGNPRTPLKAVWINESQLTRAMNDPSAAMRDDAPAELAEDHLSLAA
jgi:hypothetical protein